MYWMIITRSFQNGPNWKELPGNGIKSSIQPEGISLSPHTLYGGGLLNSFVCAKFPYHVLEYSYYKYFTFSFKLFAGIHSFKWRRFRCRFQVAHILFTYLINLYNKALARAPLLKAPVVSRGPFLLLFAIRSHTMLVVQVCGLIYYENKQWLVSRR